MVRTFATGRGAIDLGGAARAPMADDFGRRLVSFSAIGAVSTLVSLALYLLTWSALGSIGANALAVSATFVGNAWANARFTNGVRRPHWRSAGAIYLGSLAVTSAALLLVQAAGGGFGFQLAALVVSWTAVAAFRIVRMRTVPPTPPPTA
jgi:putative flippase GtrA